MAVGSVTTVNDVAGQNVASPAVTADLYTSVNLGEMIATRLSGTAVSGAGLASVLSGRQAATIMRPVQNVPTTSTRKVGSVGALDVPDNIRAYGNGRIPRELLSLIGIGQHRLVNAAADSFKAMRSDAAAAGITIGVTDSYRGYDEQVDLAARKGLYKNGGLAAVPGTSPHGWGLALDVDVTSKGLAWLRENADKYGFVETTPREPWHWEYRGPT